MSNTQNNSLFDILKHPIFIALCVTLGIAALFAFIHIKASSYSKKRVIEDCRVLLEAKLKEQNIPITEENCDPTKPENEEKVREICEEWRLNTIKD